MTQLSHEERDRIKNNRAEAIRRRHSALVRQTPFTFKVAGVNAYKAACSSVLDAGDRIVTLIPQPDNAFDKHAIAVHVGGLNIGYVPKCQTSRARHRMARSSPVLVNMGQFTYGFFATVRI